MSNVELTQLRNLDLPRCTRRSELAIAPSTILTTPTFELSRSQGPPDQIPILPTLAGPNTGSGSPGSLPMRTALKAKDAGIIMGQVSDWTTTAKELRWGNGSTKKNFKPLLAQYNEPFMP